MKLTRLVHHVTAVAMGDRTGYAGGTLTVSADDALAAIASPALSDVRVSWASPGEAVRIVKVLDAVEPRTKGPGGGGVFPGLLGPPRPQGRGSTHVMRGAAVVVAGHLPRAQEAVVDMSGPAAPLSPLGATHNLVVEFTPAPDAPWEDVDVAHRQGSLALAVLLAGAAFDVDPDEVEELPSVVVRRAGADGLPRVGVITNLQTQGTFKDEFVYGRSFANALPTLIDPDELDDGAVVSGQFGHPGLKNFTYLFQNHPVVEALRRRHGQDLEFAGLMLSPEPVDQERKELVSAHAAKLAVVAGFDAAIVTKEGGGNADGDMALKMDALAEFKIPAVGLFAEMAGSDGTGPSIVVPPERATGMVSTGNYDERLVLPAVERAFGGEQIALLSQAATDEIELPTAVVYGSLSPLGWGRLTCAEPAA